MAHQQEQPPPPPRVAGVGIPLEIWSHHFDQLHQELRTQNTSGNVRKFDGEGHQQFIDWLRDMERCKITIRADDERMRTLALNTLTGPAAEFCLRTIKAEPRISWMALQLELKERYSDLAMYNMLSKHYVGSDKIVMRVWETLLNVFLWQQPRLIPAEGPWRMQWYSKLWWTFLLMGCYPIP